MPQANQQPWSQFCLELGEVTLTGTGRGASLVLVRMLVISSECPRLPRTQKEAKGSVCHLVPGTVEIGSLSSKGLRTSFFCYQLLLSLDADPGCLHPDLRAQSWLVFPCSLVGLSLFLWGCPERWGVVAKGGEERVSEELGKSQKHPTSTQFSGD